MLYQNSAYLVLYLVAAMLSAKSGKLIGHNYYIVIAAFNSL